VSIEGSVLVTGASGFVGRAVVARLAEEGRAVIAAGRNAPAAPAGARAVAVGDLAEGVDWAPLLAGVDCVIHCAARAHVLKEEGTDPLAAFRLVNRDAALSLGRAAAEAGVRRLIFISSIGVNGAETRGRAFAAGDPPHPHSDYAVAKWEAEQGLAEIAAGTPLELVVIRPPLVIGPSPKGNLGSLLRAIRRGIPLPLGSVDRNRRDILSLDVLVDLIAACIDAPGAPGGVLLASDGQPRSTRQIVERLAREAGVRARLLPVPPAILGTALRALGKRGLAQQLLGDLEVDIGETCRRLNWRPCPAAAA
jgi:nucleoside-diphosphate-sugar epimerase